MYRIPDSYYTQRPIDGINEVSGPKQATPEFSQGEDVVISFLPMLDGKLIDPSKYVLKAILKKTVYAKNVIWEGDMDTGIHKAKDSNLYYILVKGDYTARFLPGTYFVDILSTEKIGSGSLVKDINRVLVSFPFIIKLTASSPNPKLQGNKSEEINIDVSTGITTVRVTSVEPTMPITVKTHKL